MVDVADTDRLFDTLDLGLVSFPQLVDEVSWIELEQLYRE